MNRRLKLRWLLVAAALLLAAGVALPVYNTNNLKSPTTKQRERIGLVWVALQEYAGDHDGKFPQSVSELAPDFLSPEARQFRDPATGKLSDWLYYPGHTQKDPPSTILAAFPVVVVPRERASMWVDYRIVTSIGSPTEYITETEFQRRVSHPPPRP